MEAISGVVNYTVKVWSSALYADANDHTFTLLQCKKIHLKLPPPAEPPPGHPSDSTLKISPPFPPQGIL